VLLAVGEHLLGEVPTRTFKMASIFAGGLAGTHEELCGALTAGSMVIGALHGRTRPGEDETRGRDLARCFRAGFASEFGTTKCDPIQQRFQVPGKTGSCAPVAERAVAILLQVLATEGQ
jgi:C_GCAxxG_C_C family probable redox protein